jgi:hypothetical protein
MKKYSLSIGEGLAKIIDVDCGTICEVDNFSVGRLEDVIYKLNCYDILRKENIYLIEQNMLLKRQLTKI